MKNIRLLATVLWLVSSFAPDGSPPMRAEALESTAFAEQITDPAEYSAFLAARNIPDPAARAAALEAFVKSYPQSSVTLEALTLALEAYKQAGNRQMADAVTAALLRLDPQNGRALTLASPSRHSPAEDRYAAMACAAVQQNDPASLSFSDWAFVLSYADFSPCNQMAAEKVWAAIWNRENQGTVKLALNVTLLFGTPEAIYATDGSRAYFRLELRTPFPSDMLPTGAETRVIGTITGYTVYPRFQFIMKDVELPDFKDAEPADAATLDCKFLRQYRDHSKWREETQRYFLQNRNAGPCHRIVADEIWSQLHFLPWIFHVRVVSATRDRIEAVSDRYGKQKEPDLHITMKEPMRFLPRPGMSLEIRGVYTDYVTSPLGFVVEQGEAPALVCAFAREAIIPALSFGDWEYILESANASKCNKEAADRVWEAVQDRQKSPGKMRLSIKVIAAKADSIDAAISEENQQSGRVDLRIAMGKPILRRLSEGSLAEVTGVIDEYDQRAHMFVMRKGELISAPGMNETNAARETGSLLR
jgi:hypothetical protein